jgi:cytochrome c
MSLVSVLALAACGGGAEESAQTTPDSETRVQAAAGSATAATSTAQASADAPDEDQTSGPETGTAGDGAVSGQTTDNHADNRAETILGALGGDYVDADLANGARQFRRCQSCHTLNEGGRHTVGPNLHGVMGSEAASAEGFAYSRQLSESSLVWDAATMDAWIENPRALVPGNRMSFVGLRDADDRRDVIAHIAIATADDPVEE